MKLTALFLAATLGVAYAAPISLIYITNNGRTIIRTSSPRPSSDDPFHPLAGIRFGHAAAYAQPNAATTTTITRTHSGCGGLRAKMDRVREMFGLAPVVKEEEFHIMPVPQPYPVRGEAEGKVTMMRWHSTPGLPPDGLVTTLPYPPPQYRIREQSFWDRVQHALDQLGPWEGTAVSFVLGCGLGVLLRMFFVLGVLLVRARRACSQQPIELPAEGQVIFVAPPQYIIEEIVIEEKAPVYEEVAPELLVDLDAKKD
ncbi:hypothetical protein FRC01_014837, partial [Tulasnella sp. 417]